jgi:hypothetical protein
MTGDARADDVNATEDVLRQAASDGGVRLLELAAAELCVIGAMPGPLIDDAEWSWWINLTAAQRAAIRALVLKVLVHRGLVDSSAADVEDTEGVELPIRFPLGLILVGRTEPAFIVISSQTGGRRGTETVRMYGIADAQGLRAVLAENATGRKAPLAGMGSIYEYTLLHPGRAATLLARAVAEPTETTGLMRRHPARIIDVYWPDRGAGPAYDRVAVTQRDGQLYATHDPAVPGSGQRSGYDESGIARLLVTIFERCTG